MGLLLYMFAFLPLIQAWTFRYANSANETITIHGTENLDCTDIDLPNRNRVSFDPEGTLPCLTLYHGAKCPDSEHGDFKFNSTCTAWEFTTLAAGHFRAMEVYVSGAPTATASISPSTQATATTGTTSTSPSTPSDSSSGLTLSGGAIAGIVVGLVCAFLIVAAIFFFLGRRKRKAKLEEQQNAPQAPDEPSATTGDTKTDVLSSTKGVPEKPADSNLAGVGPVPGSQLAELAASGHNRPAELATNSVHELDTHN